MTDIISLLTILKTLNGNDCKTVTSSERALAMSLNTKISEGNQDFEDDIKKLINKGLLKDLSHEIQRNIEILLTHKTYLNDDKIKKHNVIIAFLTLYWYSINYSKKFMNDFMNYMELRFGRDELNRLIKEHKQKINAITIHNKTKDKKYMNNILKKYKTDFKDMQSENIDDIIFLGQLLSVK